MFQSSPSHILKFVKTNHFEHVRLFNVNLAICYYLQGPFTFLGEVIKPFTPTSKFICFQNTKLGNIQTLIHHFKANFILTSPAPPAGPGTPLPGTENKTG